MANTDWHGGFTPYEKLKSCHYYHVTTAPVIGFYHGDMVGTSGVMVNTGIMGVLPGAYDDAVIDGLRNVLGAVLGIFDENMDPCKYIAATDAGNGTIAGFVLVADDPMQFYVGRENFGTNAIDLDDGSENADIVSVALSAGHAGTGRSTQMINSATAATTAALQLKLYGPHPNDTLLVADDTPGTSADEGCRYICKVNEAFYGTIDGAGGVCA